MKVRAHIFIVFIALGLCAWKCNTGKLDRDAYVRWIEDPGNGLRQSKKIGEVEYFVQYKPLDYVIALENEDNSLTRTDISQKKSELGNTLFFSLRIASANGKADVLALGGVDQNEYLSRQTYFSFDFHNDIAIIRGNDTIPCGMMHQVPNYGLAPYADFILEFKDDSSSKGEDLNLILFDRALGSGLVKFRISRADIQNAPTLLTE